MYTIGEMLVRQALAREDKHSHYKGENKNTTKIQDTYSYWLENKYFKRDIKYFLKSYIEECIEEKYRSRK